MKNSNSIIFSQIINFVRCSCILWWIFGPTHEFPSNFREVRANFDTGVPIFEQMVASCCYKMRASKNYDSRDSTILRDSMDFKTSKIQIPRAFWILSLSWNFTTKTNKNHGANQQGWEWNSDKHDESVVALYSRSKSAPHLCQARRRGGRGAR